MNIRIIYPNFRCDIKCSFQNLLDEEKRKGWFDLNYKHAFWDSLGYCVFEFLFDMIDIDEPEEQIGITLYDKEEAETIAKYLIFYNDTFKGNMPDFYYVNHPKWPELLERARMIIEMIEKNNEKYNIKQDLEDFDKRMRKEREVDITERIEAVASFSLKEKQEMKDKMFYCTDDEFIDVTNDIMDKINFTKGIG